MKGLVYYNKEDLRYEDIPKPEIKKGDDVLIKVHYAGICGSEYARIIGDMPVPPDVPVPHGHEFSGVVEAVGKDVTSVKPGDRVACAPRTVCGVCDDCLNDRVGQCKNGKGFIGVQIAGGWAEYCLLDEINVVKLPDGTPTYQGAFLEPLTVAVHGVQVGEYVRGKTVAIVGCGTIGALTLQVAKHYGATKLTAFDIGKERLDLALELGAEYAVSTAGNWEEEALKITDGKMYDYVFETGGVPFTEKASIPLTTPHGTLVYIGTPFTDIHFLPFEFEQINVKEIWIRGSWQSYSTPFPGKEWPESAHLLHSGEVKVDDLIDRIIPMEDIFNALEDAREKKIHGKVMLRIAEDADPLPSKLQALEMTGRR